MTREEKIEIMFESILAEIEKVSKDLESGNHQKVQDGSSNLEEKIETLSKRILNLKIPMPRLDLTPILDRLDNLPTHIDNNPTVRSSSDKGSSLRPVIDRISRIFSTPFTLIIVVILFASLATNIYLARRNLQIGESHDKYQFIYYSGNQEYLDQLDSLWRIDSIRSGYLRFTQLRKMDRSRIENQILSKDIMDQKDTLK